MGHYIRLGSENPKPPKGSSCLSYHFGLRCVQVGQVFLFDMTSPNLFFAGPYGREGPYDMEQFIESFRVGTMRLDSLVWAPSMANWMVLEESPLFVLVEDLLPQQRQREEMQQPQSQEPQQQQLHQTHKQQEPEPSEQELTWVEDAAPNMWAIASIVGSDGDNLILRKLLTKEDVMVDLGTFRHLPVDTDDVLEDLVHSNDFCNLENLHEPGILQHMENRFLSGMPYALISHKMLLATNPCTASPIEALTTTYVGMLSESNLQAIEPHPYAMAEWVYTRLCCAPHDNEAGQAVIFTGIGGSGKTECTNRIVAYLFRRSASLPSHGEGDALYNKVLQANRVLHAFGHARTETSPNSSRYGSFTRIFYARDVAVGGSGAAAAPVIVGAHMEAFLFERHRLAAPRKPAEHNFNVFYELLGARDTLATQHLDEYGLLAPSECDLLRPPYGDYTAIDTVDSTGFQELLEALLDIGFAEEERAGIFRILLGILHLGNVAFGEIDDVALRRKVSVIADQRPLMMAAETLGLNVADLTELFTNTTKEIRGTQYLARMTRAESENTKDQVIKAIYDSLFVSLVCQINFALAPEPAGELEKFPFIGLLDFPGFVNDDEGNGFDTFLCNYANEALEKTFNAGIFGSTIALLASQGIDLPNLSRVPNNDDCFQLLTAVPWGLLALADHGPGPADSPESMLDDALQRRLAAKASVLQSNPAFGSLGPSQFSVHHYAGHTTYRIHTLTESLGTPLLCDSWTFKNRNPRNRPLKSLCLQSSLPELAAVFSDKIEASVDSLGGADKDKDKDKDRDSETMSVVAKLRCQISSITQTLAQVSCQYVRCVLPNRSSRPGKFQNDFVAQQLRAMSIMETIQASKLNKPVVVRFAEIKAQMPRVYEAVLAAFVTQEHNESVAVACILHATGKIYTHPIEKYNQ